MGDRFRSFGRVLPAPFFPRTRCDQIFDELTQGAQSAAIALAAPRSHAVTRSTFAKFIRVCEVFFFFTIRKPVHVYSDACSRNLSEPSTSFNPASLFICSCTSGRCVAARPSQCVCDHQKPPLIFFEALRRLMGVVGRHRQQHGMHNPERHVCLRILYVGLCHVLHRPFPAERTEPSLPQRHQRCPGPIRALQFRWCSPTAYLCSSSCSHLSCLQPSPCAAFTPLSLIPS